MKKTFFLIISVWLLSGIHYSFAAQTDSQYFVAYGSLLKCVTFFGGTTSSTINVDTGALNTAFSPTFCMTKNNRGWEDLTLSATANTQSGATNAIFNIGTTKYITLTNNSSLPTLSQVNDAKATTPTAANNSNVIAYQIQDPTGIPIYLTVSYNSTNKNWDMYYLGRGRRFTTVNIPASSPRSETYSHDDEPGPYQATITLSFD